jgi:hypothetical protein
MMIFKLAACAALVSLAVIPVKGVDHQVTVGGTGIIAYNPNQVVCFWAVIALSTCSHF